ATPPSAPSTRPAAAEASPEREGQLGGAQVAHGVVGANGQAVLSGREAIADAEEEWLDLIVVDPVLRIDEDPLPAVDGILDAGNAALAVAGPAGHLGELHAQVDD